MLYLVLAEKGYKKETGFALLEKMRTTFLDMFSAKRIKSAKSYSLTREFKSEAKALIVNYILLIIFNSS